MGTDETASEIARNILEDLQEYLGFENWWDSLDFPAQTEIEDRIHDRILRVLDETP